MTAASLKGLCVLNTRPTFENANQRLTQTLEQYGAHVESLPLQEIKPIPAQIWLDKLLPVSEIDNIVFVSVPAVHCFFQGLEKAHMQPPTSKTIIAIGSATAKALRQYHCENVIYSANASSEDLIAEFGSLIAHQNVVIVKGPHGRTHIQEQLQSLGAKITTLDVYESQDIIYANKFLSEFWKSRPIHIILITSVKSFLSLYQQLPKPVPTEWTKIHLLVLSERIKLEAEKLVKNPIIVCKHDKILHALLTFNAVKT